MCVPTSAEEHAVSMLTCRGDARLAGLKGVKNFAVQIFEPNESLSDVLNVLIST